MEHHVIRDLDDSTIVYARRQRAVMVNDQTAVFTMLK